MMADHALLGCEVGGRDSDRRATSAGQRRTQSHGFPGRL